MSTKIVISGFWYSDDKKYIEHSEDLQIIHYPGLDSIQEKDLPLFLQNAREADLVILSLHGKNLDSYFNIPGLHPFLHDTQIRKVMWTQDAQHEWGMGLKYQKYFSRYYWIHSPTLDKCKEVETYWLPCCFCWLGIDQLIAFLSSPTEIKDDIIFPYMKYTLDDRPMIASKIEQKVSSLGLINYFGMIQHGMPYLLSIQGSRICLNISTLGSLNLRNFEVWGLNRVLLTEKVVDHENINADFTHTYFFDRDLSNFDDALEKALNDNLRDIRTSYDVINHHMLVHRYVEIINNELATNYKVMNINIPQEKMCTSGLDYVQIAYSVESVPGHLVSGQEKYLFDKVKGLPNDAVIVEIGSFKGRSTVSMGFACVGTKRKIYCIDTWDGNESDFQERNCFDIWQENIDIRGLKHYIIPLKGRSHAILAQWDTLAHGEKIDFIFIDGSHQFVDVLRDFKMSYPLVKEGGFFAFHDVVDTWPGPHRAWNEIAKHILLNHEYCATLACGQKVLVNNGMSEIAILAPVATIIKALEENEKIIEEKEKHIRNLELKASMPSVENLTERVSLFLEEAFLLKPDMEYWQNRADHYYAAGRYEDALEIYKGMEMRNPEDCDILQELAHLHTVLRNFKEASKYYQRIEKINPDDSDEIASRGQGTDLSII